MPDSDADLPPAVAASMDGLQNQREAGGDPNHLPGNEPNDLPGTEIEKIVETVEGDPVLDLKHITERNREFSRSKSFLRFCSDRELLAELKFRGYGRPDPK